MTTDEIWELEPSMEMDKLIDKTIMKREYRINHTYSSNIELAMIVAIKTNLFKSNCLLQNNEQWQILHIEDNISEMPDKVGECISIGNTASEAICKAALILSL